MPILVKEILKSISENKIMFSVFGVLSVYLLISGWSSFLHNVYLNSIVEPVEAVVVHRRLSERVTKDPQYMGGGTSETYYPRVTFLYTVDGKQYESKSPYAKEEGFTRKKGREVLFQFEKNVPLQAFVHPNKPEVAFLVKRVRPFTGFIITLGFFFFAYLVGWIISDLKKSDLIEDIAWYRTFFIGNGIYFLLYFLAGGTFHGWVFIQIIFCIPGFSVYWRTKTKKNQSENILSSA